MCHEPCDRPACDEACKKLLPCGHACIGLCGEPCPPLCRLCDESEVREVFFGTEDEPDARFMLLVDCKHVLEVTGMDGWIESRRGDDDAIIQMPECPKCKTPIRNKNRRYSALISKQMELIDMVKLRMNQNKSADEIENEKNRLCSAIDADIAKNPNLLRTLADHVRSAKHMSYPELVSFQNKHAFALNVTSLEEKLTTKYELDDDQQVNQHVNYELNKIKNAIKDRRLLLREQKVLDIQSEIKRIDHLIMFYYFKKLLLKRKEITIDQYLTRMEILLIGGGKVNRFDEQLENKLRDIESYLNKYTNVTITQEERTMIHKAMGFQKGHWFKCPNGHIYAIGECGGAMQTATCPECGCAIGGANHALIATNSLASEMDGATYAAWSDVANNMENWRI